MVSGVFEKTLDLGHLWFFSEGIFLNNLNPWVCPAAIWSLPGVDAMAVPEAGSKGNRFPTSSTPCCCTILYSRKKPNSVTYYMYNVSIHSLSFSPSLSIWYLLYTIYICRFFAVKLSHTLSALSPLSMTWGQVSKTSSCSGGLAALWVGQVEVSELRPPWRTTTCPCGWGEDVGSWDHFLTYSPSNS